MKLEFLNNEHKAKFQEVRMEMADIDRFNKEFLAAAFIILGDAELEEKMKPYLDPDDGLLDSVAVFEQQDFSNEGLILAKLAAHLFDNSEQVLPLDLVKLEGEKLKLAMEAIMLRRYGISTEYEVPGERLIM